MRKLEEETFVLGGFLSKYFYELSLINAIKDWRRSTTFVTDPEIGTITFQFSIKKRSCMCNTYPMR